LDGRGDADEALVVAWLQDHLDGEVVAITRQARWRPAWFVDLRRQGQVLALYVRGERKDMAPVFPLRHEMAVQQLLEEHGIPVPHVHGFCDEPPAIVMDRHFGCIDFRQSSDEERQAVMDDYVDILARMHRLDVRPFARAGAEWPADRAEVALTGMRAYEAVYRSQKTTPDPFGEFCLAWLRRNPPPGHRPPAVVVWDSGQLMHRDGRVVALLDLELAHIGDPLMDLAGFRMRDTVLGFGDLGRLYRRYAEVSGTEIDPDAIEYFHFAFALTTQLALQGASATPGPETDLMTYRHWCSESNLYAIEALAGILGVALDPPEEPVAELSPVTTAHRHLVQSLRSLEMADEFGSYRLRAAFRLARHLERYDEIGAAVLAADLDDLVPLLGRRPAGWEESEVALEDFVLQAGPESDAVLVRIFYRRLHRRRLLLGPPTSAMTKHLPLQPISGSVDR
jgi:aminoglycoside phosphotransferase (APT) family kinase protein